MDLHNLHAITDRELLSATERAAAVERRATASLLRLLAEVDTRRLYLGEGFSSLFTYATTRLHLSEPAAYSRITAARAARRFPAVFAQLDEGALTLTTIGLLTTHLTEENVDLLIEAARHKTKREVEQLVVSLHPQPDIPTSVRALPAARAVASMTTSPSLPRASALPQAMAAPARATATELDSPHRPALVAPLAPSRYLIRMTVGEDTHAKFERARDLLRHALPDGDPAAVFDRALTALLGQLERARIGGSRPRRVQTTASPPSASRGRRIPVAVRRAVWARDQGRCAFTGAAGRCAETGRLEFHHVVPFASGGAASVENIQLRCRAHNAYEGELVFGEKRGDRHRADKASAPSGRS